MQNVLGQPDAIAVLQAALRSGRIHHAWIFSGPFGVGKLTTAIELAKILLDREAGPTLTGEIEADPQGRVARMVDARSHPDLHVIYKELALYSDNRALRERKLMNIPLDLLRERMLGGRTGDDRYHEAAAYRTPIEGHRKVFVIDEAELIDRTGQNALLKTLEEPPRETFLILVTSRPRRLLPTIWSRAQHVRFRPLDEASLRRWFDQAELEVDGAERAWIEWYCQGSPGAAMLAARYGLHRWQRALDPILEALGRGEYPPDPGAAMGELIDGFAEAWVKDHQGASKDAANKAGARHLLGLLAANARREMEQAIGQDESQVRRWLDVIDLLPKAEGHLDANVNLKHVLENLAAQCLVKLE